MILSEEVYAIILIQCFGLLVLQLNLHESQQYSLNKLILFNQYSEIVCVVLVWLQQFLSVVSLIKTKGTNGILMVLLVN